jgi:hypothetical protein
MGRPPLEVKRSAWIRARITEEEKKKLTKMRGDQSESDYVRAILFGKEK